MAALSTETAAKILGVSLDYSLEDLREAYRKTLQETCREGSVNNTQQQQRLQQARIAYTKLFSDMEERNQIDRGNTTSNKDESQPKESSAKSGGNKKKKNPSSSASSPSMPSISMPPLPFPPEFAAKCLNAAAMSGGNVNLSAASGASVTITKGRMFGPSPPPSKSNNNSKDPSTKNMDSTSTTTNIDLAALAQSGFSFADLGIDIPIPSGAGNGSDESNQKNAAPCSEAEMKALMSMFVEFVGMVSDQDNIGNSGNKSSNPTMTRENFIRLNAAALAAASASNMQGQNTSSSFSNKSGKSGGQTSASPFPVFSMLLGAGAGGSNGPGFDFSGESIKVLNKKMSAHNHKASKGNRTRTAHTSAPQAFPVNSSESGSEWIEYYDDEADETEDGHTHSSERPDRSANEGDGSSIEDLILDENGQTNRDQFLKWSRKIHSVINVADSFSIENRNNSSPLRHKRTKQHAQNLENLHHAHAQSIKGNRNQNINSNSFVMPNGKYNDFVKSYSGTINNALNKKTSNWDSTTEETALEDTYINKDQNDSIGKDDEEKAKKAAKKREKKNRKKEKAKREAALKAAQSAQKRRDAKITSWRSRVVTACSNGDIGKLESLLGDSPFKNLEKSAIIQNIHEKHDISTKKESAEEDSSDITGDIASLNEFANDDVTQHMEWLLHACFPKYNQKQSNSEKEAKHKLSLYVMKMSFAVIFQPIRNGMNLVHAAAQTGDVDFIKHVSDRLKSFSNEDLEAPSSLNSPCDDAGWSPLHYASAFGCIEVMEVLLENGSDVKCETEQNLTGWRNNSNGVTVRELVECIKSANAPSLLYCNGKAFYEAVDNYSRMKESSKGIDAKAYVFSTIVSRLLHIEENGYSPPLQEMTTSGHQPKTDKASKSSSQLSNRASGEESKKKKRSRKKKGQQQLSKSQPETSKSAVTTLALEKDEKESDPLVEALLSMGFTPIQISAAANACGGTDNATADDLVAWIFENEAGNSEESQYEETNTPSSQISSKPVSSANKAVGGSKISLSGSNAQPMQNHVTMLKAQHQQRMADKAAAQVMRDEEDAVERERVAKAAAQRLAAKREEQRRINREWNNREQNRQKEEAQAKAKEEMEKRRAVELSKVREAQKRTQLLHPHPLANPQNSPSHLRMGHHTAVPHPPIILQNTVSGIAHHPPHFQNQHAMSMPLPAVEPKHYDMLPPDIHQMNTSAPAHPDVMSFRQNRAYNQSYENQIYGRPSQTYLPDQKSTDYNDTSNVHRGNSLPVFVDNVGYKAESYKKAPTQKGKKLEVNNFEFPELGKELDAKEVKGNSHQSNSAPHSVDQTFSSGGVPSVRKKGKGRNAKNKNLFSPANTKKLSSSIPPPGFQPSPPPYPEAAKDINTVSNDVNTANEPNQLGEIRATAKVFIPTFFKPPTSEKDGSHKSNIATAPLEFHENKNLMQSQSTPPPFAQQSFALPIHSNDAFSSTSCATRPDTLDQSTDLLAPMNSLLSSSNHSRTPGDPTGLLPPMSSSAMSTHPNSAPSSNPHSPIQSSASSITGGTIPIGDEQAMVGNAMLFENHLAIQKGGSSILGSLNRSVSQSSPLENIPLSGNSNIWGDAVSSSTGLGGFSAFGMSASPLSENQNEANLNTKNDSDGAPEGGWSSGGVLGGNSTGGSIW